MTDVVSVTVLPDIRLVGVVNAALDAFCTAARVSRQDSCKLQLAVEEVFTYCVKTIRKGMIGSGVTARFSVEEGRFRIVMEHDGPRGELDVHFRPGKQQSFDRKTFEALGLSLAAEILDSMECRHDRIDRMNRFVMHYSLDNSKNVCGCDGPG